MRNTPNVPKNPPGWEVRSEYRLFGHTVRMHQHRYMLVLQIDDLYLVAGVSDGGNITVPAKMAIVNDLDTAKAICDHALAMDAPKAPVEPVLRVVVSYACDRDDHEYCKPALSGCMCSCHAPQPPESDGDVA